MGRLIDEDDLIKALNTRYPKIYPTNASEPINMDIVDSVIRIVKNLPSANEKTVNAEIKTTNR